MKRLRIFQLIIVTLFFFFIITIFLPKDYTKKYKVEKIEVTEKYNKKTKTYYFTFNVNEVELAFLSDNKYKNKRGLVENIKLVENENDFCIIPESKKIEFIPMCYQDEEVMHFTTINNELKSKLPEQYFLNEKKLGNYNDIEIYNYDYTYFIWNYDGFYFINKEEVKKIDIFEKEFYNVNLIGYTKDYLVIADYDSNYTFNIFYTIDLKDGKQRKYELDYSIYFDSYYVGYEKNKLYIVDNKENAMYEFNAKNGDIEKIKSKIIENSEWKSVKIKTLINQDKKFTYKKNISYVLKDKKLYIEYPNYNKSIIATKDIDKIVRTKDDEIFYLKNDTLYSFTQERGEVKLLNYFEWNFNNENMIFIN